MFSIGKKTIVIEPATRNASAYLVSLAINLLPKTSEVSCSMEEEKITANTYTTFPTDNTDDRKLRTFRLAVSVDGEFSEFHGSTVVNSLAAINDLMSYINPIYERDLSIHMNLIANNDQIIYLDKTTDPYISPTTDAQFLLTGNLNSQLQTNLKQTIGESNYDIGILFTNQAFGGNAGILGGVCVDGGNLVDPPPLQGHKIILGKGSAYTGGLRGGPQGYGYAMLIAHEMGHQYGANHTFSKPEGDGSASFPETGANREPGSGTTIMGYPGSSAGYDVMDRPDDQFLHYSISQINNYIKTTTCAAITDMTNNPPMVNAGPDISFLKELHLSLQLQQVTPITIV